MDDDRIRIRIEDDGLSALATVVTGAVAEAGELARALDAAGATCVELGLPFSDPIADGPVLQAAAERALRGGATFAAKDEMFTMNPLPWQSMGGIAASVVQTAERKLTRVTYSASSAVMW